MAVSSWVPDALKIRLRSHRCVAFVGAGFSAPCMPDWGKLLRELYNESYKNPAFKDRRSDWSDWDAAIRDRQFELGASLMYHYLPEPQDRVWLSQQIKDRFGSHRLYGHANNAQMVKRMRLLAEIPWLGIVTTNFDLLIKKGFEDSGKKCGVFVRGFHTGQDEPWNGLLLGGAHDLQCETESPWILHLHGTVDDDRITLSAEQFEDLYVHDRRVESFIGALLLSANVVFLGCSMTDEIVKIRRVLRKRFRNIPMDFAFMVSSDENRRKKKYLKESAGIEVILYGRNDNDYPAFDECLQELSECAPPTPDKIGGRMLSNIASSNIPERLEVLDEENLALLRLVDRHGPVNYSTLMTPDDELTKRDPDIWQNLLAIGAQERFYRMAFLVQLRLVRDEFNQGYTTFELDPENRDEIRSAMTCVAA